MRFRIYEAISFLHTYLHNEMYIRDSDSTTIGTTTITETMKHWKSHEITTRKEQGFLLLDFTFCLDPIVKIYRNKAAHNHRKLYYLLYHMYMIIS